MVGTPTATTGTDVVVLRLRVPSPPTLADPFVTGTLQGSSELGAIQLLAYAQGDDYKYGRSGRAAACSPPAGSPIQVLGVGGKIPACAHLIDQLVTSYRLVAQDHHHGGGTPARLPRRMHVSQMHCTADGAVRAYMVFSNNTEWRAHRGFIVGEEAAVAEGRWDSARGMLCLRAWRVARSAVLPSTLAVGECGIGMSFWFLSVWTVRDRSVVAGMLWNTSAGAGNDRSISGVNVVSAFSVDDPAGHHRRNLSDVRYEYNDTMLEEAKMHYLAINKQDKVSIRGSFPVPGNHYATYHDFSLFSFGANGSGSGDAYPVSIGSVMMGEDALAAADDDSFSRHAVAGQLLSVSYDMHHYAPPDHRRLSHSRRLERQQIKAEGVYDPRRGILCMVGCREQDGSTPDCRVLVTVQLASMEQGHDGGRGVISSLRDRTDRLFFEKMEIDLYGMYSAHLSEAVSRIDLETVMLVASTTLSCVFAAAQILHTKRNPEAARATSVTMLAVLAMGYLVPLALSFEVLFASRRSRYGFGLADNNGWWPELNQVMVNVPALVAFLLHLRLLQLVFSSGRRRSVADQGKPPVTTSERAVLKICLPLYLLGAVLAAIVHAIKIRSASEVGLVVVPAGGGAPATLREDLASYTGLIVDGFLLPQVILNAPGCCSGSGVVGAISPWFYMGGTAIRVMPHVYDLVRRHVYEQSMSPSDVYASARGDIFGVAWDIVVPCGAALLASLLFWQQRLPVGGALW